MNWQENVRRVEPYIPGEQPKQEGMIKLNTNECPYPPAPEVEKAIREFQADLFRLYPDPEASVLVLALAEYYGVSKDQVFVGVGSDDVLALAFLTFFNSELPILFPDVTYSFYQVWAGLFGIPFQEQALDGQFRIRKEDYLIPNGGIIFPNPNAPTGQLESTEMIEEIVRSNPGAVVIIDEAYIDFGGESVMPLVDRYENLLVVQTFSKSRAMAGMRIGFAVGSPKLIGFLKDAKFSFNSYTMNQTALVCGAAAIKEEGYFREILGRIVSTRERVELAFRNMGFILQDSRGNFIFATHPLFKAEELQEGLRGVKIYVRRFSHPRINDYLRISVGTDREMDVLLDFLKAFMGGKENG